MQNKFAVIAMIMMVMIGTLGLGAATTVTTYDSSVTLDNKDDCSATGACTSTPDDGIGAVIEYNSKGDEFEWSASGTAPLANTDYSLIYYADPWPGNNPGAFIGEMTTDDVGNFTGSGSKDIGMDLPHADDANDDGAKIWMIPSGDYAQPMTVWNPDNYLFENELITYVDCDLYDTAPPAIATFTIEDALVGEPMNITITNATNVGAVEVVLTYNASALTISNVVNGDMDSTWSNDVSGQVTIGTNQGDNTGLNGDFILAGLNFTPINNGAYDFSYVVVTYKDATPCGRTMPYDFGDDIGVMYLNGDVNNDGDVDMFDVMYLAKNVIGISGFENIIELASDVDGDGDIDMEDVTYLAMHIVGASSWEVLL